jgi:hypothetical protein
MNIHNIEKAKILFEEKQDLEIALKTLNYHNSKQISDFKPPIFSCNARWGGVGLKDFKICYHYGDLHNNIFILTLDFYKKRLEQVNKEISEL